MRYLAEISDQNGEVKNFGILLKGQSLELLSKYSHEFQSCFIVSDFDDELPSVKDLIQRKKIIHFTNRSKQAQLSRNSYKIYNIKDIQAGQIFRWCHFRLMQAALYRFMLNPRIKFHFLPEHLLSLNDELPLEYQYKFPNTGILSVLFALNIIKPKNLWIFGLDFYEAPYMNIQTQSTNLSIRDQNQKIERLNLKNFLFENIKQNNSTVVHLASYAKEIPQISNLIKLS